MSMATALAFKSPDGNLMVRDFTACKINDIAIIGTMGDEISFGMAGRTFLQSMGIGVHNSGKQRI